MARTVSHPALEGEAIAAASPAWRVPNRGERGATAVRRTERARAAAMATPVPRRLRLLTLAAWVVAVVWAAHDHLLRAYGDALSHELIARRVIDSLHPGIGQLGTVWLPLPSLLLTPLVWIDPLWRSGLAGALLGALFLHVSVGALYRTGVLLGGATMGWVAAIAFLANPNTLYLFATPLLEVAALAFTCLCIAAAARVLDGLPRGAVHPEALFAAALFAACGMLSRYDNWMTGALVGAGLLVATGWWLRDRLAVQAVAICYALIPCCAAALWLLYNFAVFGDPLAFLRGEYASGRIVRDLAANGAIPTINGHPPEQGHPLRALLTYLTAVGEVVGVVPLLLAAAGGLVAAVRMRRHPVALIYPMLLGPLLFYVLALTRAESVIVTRAAQPGGIFNIRYGVALAPLVALAIGACVGFPGRRARIAGGIIAAVVLAAGVGQLFEPLGPAIVAEGRLQDRAPNAQASHAAARWFARQPYDGLTLVDDALQPQSKILYAEGGRALRDYVDSSDPAEWAAALAAPPPAITMIVTLGPASGQRRNDRVGGALVHDGQIAGFAPVYDDGEIVIFRRAEGGAR